MNESEHDSWHTGDTSPSAGWINPVPSTPTTPTKIKKPQSAQNVKLKAIGAFMMMVLAGGGYAAYKIMAVDGAPAAIASDVPAGYVRSIGPDGRERLVPSVSQLAMVDPSVRETGIPDLATPAATGNPATANCPTQGFAARMWDYSRSTIRYNDLAGTLDVNMRTKELRLLVSAPEQVEVRRTAAHKMYLKANGTWKTLSQSEYASFTGGFLKLVQGNSYVGEFVAEVKYNNALACHYRVDASSSETVESYLDSERHLVYQSGADTRPGAEMKGSITLKQIPAFSVADPI
jgi:hypothetical protein